MVFIDLTAELLDAAFDVLLGAGAAMMVVLSCPVMSGLVSAGTDDLRWAS